MLLENEIEDKEFVNQTRLALAKELRCYRNTISLYIEELENIEIKHSTDDLMFFKRNILDELVEALPIGADTCFFCLKYQDDCEVCPYAQMNGNCHAYTSVYGTLQAAKRNLREAIKDYWCPGDYDYYMRLVSVRLPLKEEDEEEKEVDNEYRPL